MIKPLITWFKRPSIRNYLLNDNANLSAKFKVNQELPAKNHEYYLYIAEILTSKLKQK
jgi:hypothetical protein